MSKHNYNQAYRNARSEINVVDEAIPENVIDEVVDVVVQNTLAAVDGTVCNCEKLNIRIEPNKESKVLTVVSKADKLVIFIDESTEGWYKVQTEDGVEGFCMREYVL